MTSDQLDIILCRTLRTVMIVASLAAVIAVGYVIHWVTLPPGFGQ